MTGDGFRATLRRMSMASALPSVLPVGRGPHNITAPSECPVPGTSERREVEVSVVVRDAGGEVAERSTLRSLVGPKPSEGGR